jgi:hypothetical protein
VPLKYRCQPTVLHGVTTFAPEQKRQFVSIKVLGLSLWSVFTVEDQLVVRKVPHSWSFRLVCLHYYLMKLSSLAFVSPGKDCPYCFTPVFLRSKRKVARCTKHIRNLQEFTQAGQNKIWGQVPSFSNVTHSGKKRTFIRS